MKKSIKNKVMNTGQDVLPAGKTEALKMLIKVSEKIMNLSEQETQALIQDDLAAFALLQREKSNLATQYAKASEEFRIRFEEFRAADPGLLDRLEKLQNEMGEKLRSNNEIVSRMFSRSKKKATESLITVQELAQQRPLHMNDDAEGQKNGAL